MTRSSALGLLAALLLAAPAPAQQAPTGLTIYGDGRVLVRRSFPLAVARGAGSYLVPLGPADPASVFSLDPAVSVTGLAYDGAVDERSTLRRAVGRTVGMRVTVDDSTEVVPVTVLSADPERFRLPGGGVLFGRLGPLVYPDSLVVLEPAAQVAVQAAAARPALALGWFTGGASWQAAYHVLLGRAARVSGAAVISADRLAASDAEVQLLAGDVGRAAKGPGMADGRVMELAAAPAPPTEQAIGEAHLYTLPGRVTLVPGTVTTAELFEPAEVPFERGYTVRGLLPRYGMLPQDPEGQPRPVEVTYLLRRPRASAFGDRPLPAGVVRLYQADAQGRAQLVGEGAIGHAPAGEDLRVPSGTAFDLVARVTQAEYRQVRDTIAGGRVVRTGAVADYRVTLRNAGDTAATVDVLEERAGEWTVLSSSVPAEKLSSTVTRFRVAVPARGEATLTYRVRVYW